MTSLTADTTHAYVKTMSVLKLELVRVIFHGYYGPQLRVMGIWEWEGGKGALYIGSMMSLCSKCMMKNPSWDGKYNVLRKKMVFIMNTDGDRYTTYFSPL